MTTRISRPFGDELLDHPDANPEEVLESLRHIARSNRWFGGWSAVRHGLTYLCGSLPAGTELTLLDLGTGMGDIPALAERWAWRRGLVLMPMGLEQHRAAARIAWTGGLPCVIGDAAITPMRSKSVDLVILSQVLHHFRRERAIRVLAEANRIASLGVIVADLQRSQLAIAGYWVGARLLRFDAASKADGLTSIRRGYTRLELEDLLRTAGIRAKVVERPGFRLVAAWEPR